MPRPKPGSRRPHPRDKPCRRCLAPLVNVDDRFCPTCGLSVWFSLNPNDSLDTASPNWLSSIILGTRLMAAGVMLLFAAAILPHLDLPIVRVHSAFHAIVAGGLLLNGIALLLFARPEYRVPDTNRTMRGVMRVLAAFTLLNSVAHLPMPIARIVAPVNAFEHTLRVSLIANEPLPLLKVAIAITTWIFIRGLARRARVSKISKIAGWFMLLPLIPFLKFIPIIGVAIAAAAWSAIDLIELLYDPAAAVLLLWAGAVFARARRDARHTWDAETTPPPAST